MSGRTTKHVKTAELERQRSYIESVREAIGNSQSYYIYTYGCQLNDNDSEKLAAILTAMGYCKTEIPAEASIILMNTCSIRGNADQRFFGNLGIVKTFKDKNPNLIVGVCGCMMQIEEHVERIRQSYPFVDLIFGTSDIHRLPEILQRRLSGARRVYDISNEDLIVEGVPVQHERRYRALCTIMYGCNNFCTYCIVPYTRGRERSRNKDAVLQELKGLAEQGFQEVMLLGQNVNAYGKDLATDGKPLSFAELLDEAATSSGLRRIRFMTSHPKDISPELLTVMARHNNIENHLHLPLQSGSNRILKKMNRHYTKEHYLDIVRRARILMPDISLTTDIIVGFPGETENDFAETLAVVREVAYNSAYMFQYSPRIGTPAALSEQQIPAEIVTERFNRLVELQNQNSLHSHEKMVGRTEEVLIEGRADHHEGQLTGRNSANQLINFTAPADLYDKLDLPQGNVSALGNHLEGNFAKVLVTDARMFSLVGELKEIEL